MKRTAKEHIHIAHGHRQQCGEGQRDGRRDLGTEGMRVGNGDICNNVNNKKI